MELRDLAVERDGYAVIIRINRPDKLNSLNKETLNELSEVVSEIETDESVKVVVVTGAGEKAFSAGADISEMKDMTTLEAEDFSRLGQEALMKIEHSAKPYIAAVNGLALGGGCELALACDIRIASNRAKFGQPEVGLAVLPGFGGTFRLSRIVGVGLAKELILTGKVINAEDALRIGLVNRVVDADKLMNDSLSLASEISGKGLIAVKLAKNLINQSFSLNPKAAMELEREAFALTFSTSDQKEGMSAFIEKRKPNFQSQ